jgi:transposase
MEAKGNYHYKLACFLKGKGFVVFVHNPLWVKRFVQSLGTSSKTDKKDARLIAQYTLNKDTQKREFEPLPDKLHRAKNIITILHHIAKLERSSGNVNLSISHALNKDSDLLIPVKNIEYVLDEEKEKLEKELFGICKEFYPKEFKLLQTIKGIGERTAATILIELNGLDFETSSQAASFCGIVPSTYESGVSIKGSGKIRKIGSAELRRVLYSCVASAIQWNNLCKDLYQRLVLKFRTHKQASVAVMRRLVKIAYGVVKSGEAFRGGKRLQPT